MTAPRLRRRRVFEAGLAIALASAFASEANASPSGRAWLGILLEKGDPGLVAKRVLRGSPADLAGIRSGDLLLEADGAALSTPRDFIQRIQAAGPSAKMRLHLRHAAKESTIEVTLAEHPGDEEVLRLDQVGAFAANWKGVKATQGESSNLKKLRGRVVLLDFWASWCGVCRALAPKLNELHDTFGARGLIVVGLTDDTEEKAISVMKKLDIRYAIGSETSAETISDYLVSALPTSFLIDKRGVVRQAHVGLVPMKQLVGQIEKLLAEPA